MNRLRGVILSLGIAWAVAGAPWQSLTNCTLVEDRNNDGDSFRVRSGTNVFVARLYAVDCPETKASLKARVNDQAAHWQTNAAGVLSLGTVAAEFTRTNLAAGAFAVRHRGTRTLSGGRIYAYVTLADGRDLGGLLLTNGLARKLGFDPLGKM